MPEYKVTVIGSDAGDWKRYVSEIPLEYGNEITIEADDGSTARVRVVGVDNDAFFTSEVTVELV